MQCLEIIDDKNKLNHSQMEAKWVDFIKKYNTLYTYLTTENNVDLEMIKFLCEKAEDKTSDKVDKDMEVGEFIAKKYINNDTFKEKSKEEKESIKNKIREKIKEKGNADGRLSFEDMQDLFKVKMKFT
tara:strand:- start:998 stop:1381 length:384 start_codon:yes stop_codon:yes gene_type:complete